jgi:hypothetical protein
MVLTSDILSLSFCLGMVSESFVTGVTGSYYKSFGNKMGDETKHFDFRQFVTKSIAIHFLSL